MEERKRELWRIARDGVMLAVFHFPLAALERPVGEGLPEGMGLALLLAASGALSFCALWDERMKSVVLKWLVSVPFSLMLMGLPNEITVRWINKQEPGYGELSAGSGLGILIGFAAFFGTWLAAFLLALAFSSPGGGRLLRVRRRVQGIVLPVIAVIIVLALAYIDSVTPSLTEIYWYTYG